MLQLSYFRKKYLINLWKRWKFLLILWLTFLILYLIIIGFFFDFTKPDYINLFVSFACGLIFFTVGIITAMLGSKLPQEEHFNTRVSVIANGKYANRDAETYLTDKIRLLITYANHSKLVLTLLKLSHDSKYVYLHVESTSTLANMCEDIDVKLNVEGGVYPDFEIDGTRGQVTHHSIKRDNLSEIFFIKQGQTVDLDDEPNFRYDVDQPISVNSNSTSIIKLCYKIWIPLTLPIEEEKNWFYHIFPILTVNSQIEIISKLKIPVNFNYKHRGRIVYSNIDKSSYINHSGILNAMSNMQVASDLTFVQGDKFEVYLNV